jgi:hypothetical protein
LLLDEEGNNVPLVQVSPSDLAAAALAVGLASAELLGHHTSFTLNNMVSSSRLAVCIAVCRVLCLRSMLASAELLGHHTSFTLNNLVSWIHVLYSCVPCF